MAKGKINTISTETPSIVSVVLEGEPKIEEETEVVIDVTTPVERKVKVNPKITFKQFIGDRWYYFNAGEVVSVPPNVREVLLRQGALDVLP